MIKWQNVSVGTVCQQIRGVSYSKSDASSSSSSGRIPLLRAGNITDHGLKHTDLVYVPETRVKPEQRLRSGDVVIATSSGSLDVVGKAAQFEDDLVMTFGAFCKALRPGPQVDAGYFSHFFQTASYRRTVSALAAGVNINNLRNDDLDNLEIPLPPLPEQRRIAAILNQADALRIKPKSAIQHAIDLEKRLFLDTFAKSQDRATLTVRDLAAKVKNSVRTGPFGSQLLHSEFTDGGVAVLGIDNVVDNVFRWATNRFISNEKYKQLKRYTVFPGDVLVSIMGTCGRCAIVPDDIPLTLNTKHLCCITVDRSLTVPEYLRGYFLYHPTARSYLTQKTKGAIMAGLNMTIILDMPIFLPGLSKQERYVENLRKLAALTSSLNESIAQLDTLFASLQFRAFAGEL